MATQDNNLQVPMDAEPAASTSTTSQYSHLSEADANLLLHFSSSKGRAQASEGWHAAFQETPGQMADHATGTLTMVPRTPIPIILLISLSTLEDRPIILAVNLAKLATEQFLGDQQLTLSYILGNGTGKFSENLDKLVGPAPTEATLASSLPDPAPTEATPASNRSQYISYISRQRMEDFFLLNKDGQETLNNSVEMRVLKYHQLRNPDPLLDTHGAVIRQYLASKEIDESFLKGDAPLPGRFLSCDRQYFPSLLNQASCIVDDLRGGCPYGEIKDTDDLPVTASLFAAPQFRLESADGVQGLVFQVAVIHVLPFKPSGAVVSYGVNTVLAYFERSAGSKTAPSCGSRALP